MIILFFILILGLILRLINLNQSFWLDEAISALAARDFSYTGIAFDFLRIDNHPFLFYMLLKFWGETFGYFDWVLRTLSVALGVLLIVVSYLLGRAIFENKKHALLLSLLISTSPLLIYYSQEVRMYILITVLVAIQTFVFLSLIKSQAFWKWTLFAFLNCLLFFSDYITIFFLPALFIFPIIKKDFKFLFKTILSFVPLAGLFYLWYPMFESQLLKNSQIVSSFPGWQHIVGGATIKNLVVLWMKFVLGRISFEPKSIYYLLVILGSLPLLISLYFALKRFKKDLVIWLWLIVPLITGFAFSFLIPVFNYFRFIYILPALLILVSIGIYEAKSKTLKRLLITSILLTNFVGLGIYYIDPLQQRENWRQAVDYIETTPRGSELVVFEFLEPLAPYRWYSRQTVEVIGATDSYFADPVKTPLKLEPALDGKSRIYHFEYLGDLTDPSRIIDKKLKEEGFIKSEVANDFNNIGQLNIWERPLQQSSE